MYGKQNLYSRYINNHIPSPHNKNMCSNNNNNKNVVAKTQFFHRITSQGQFYYVCKYAPFGTKQLSGKNNGSNKALFSQLFSDIIYICFYIVFYFLFYEDKNLISINVQHHKYTVLYVWLYIYTKCVVIPHYKIAFKSLYTRQEGLSRSHKYKNQINR